MLYDPGTMRLPFTVPKNLEAVDYNFNFLISQYSFNEPRHEQVLNRNILVYGLSRIGKKQHECFHTQELTKGMRIINIQVARYD